MLFSVHVDLFGDPFEEYEKRVEGRRCRGMASRGAVCRFFRRQDALVSDLGGLLARLEDCHLCSALTNGRLSDNFVVDIGNVDNGMTGFRCLVSDLIAEISSVRVFHYRKGF